MAAVYPNEICARAARALVAALGLCLAAGAAGCTKDKSAPAEKPAEPATHDTAEQPGDNAKPTKDGSHMAIDTSQAAWDQALALAAEHSGKEPDELRKKNDELPFVFVAKGMRPVVVLDGKVVTATGAQAAADYLRRLGIAHGQALSLNSVLYALFALHGFPAVDQLPPESYVFADSARMKDLTARVDTEPGKARIVLHYFKPDKEPEGDSVGPEVHDVVRMTLEIADQAGQVAWQREDFQWTAPE